MSGEPTAPVAQGISENTVVELFKIWNAECETGDPQLPSTAKSFFQRLSDAEVCSVSYDKALSLLVRGLESSFSTSNLRIRLAAVSCLVGALQGTPKVSSSLVTLLGSFLVTSTGPLRNEDGLDHDFEDYSDQTRDSAISGVTHLITLTADPDQALLKLAKEAVIARCGQVELDAYGLERPYTSGLSLLSRSRRSLCFQCVRAAIDVLAKVDRPTDTLLTREFCQFAVSCLHGESDPRCLLEMLNLLDALFRVFSYVKGFPLSELFDAVAPYYPIQFSPPPNDRVGITRDMLRQAILRVLASSKIDTPQTSMSDLATQLVLEQLLEDESISPNEQTEYLEDLLQVIDVPNLDISTIRSLSKSLQQIHRTASINAVSATHNATESRDLANLCRKLSAQVAVSAETRNSLWCSFVEEPFKSFVRASPTDTGRVQIAYLANLASCGGPKTLRIAMECTVPILIKSCASNEVDESAAAFLGLGAFFASCRTALRTLEDGQTKMHPHPLASIAARAFDVVEIMILEAGDENCRAAAIRAIESIVLSAPAELFPVAYHQKVLDIANRLLRQLLLGSGSSEEENEACAKTLGSFLVRALSSRVEDLETTTLLESANVHEYLRGDVFHNLLENASKDVVVARYARRVLQEACTTNATAASFVVEKLLHLLMSDIMSGQAGSRDLLLATIRQILMTKDGFAAQAVVKCTDPSIFDIIQALAPPPGKDEALLQAPFRLNGLQIPQSASEELLNVGYSITAGYNTTLCLREAYTANHLSTDIFDQFVTFVEQVLPPLSQRDAAQLSLVLPLFSAVLVEHPYDPIAVATESVTVSSVRKMIPALADFLLTLEYDRDIRLHAGRCLRSIISRYTPRNAQECPVKEIVGTKVMPELIRATESFSSDSCDNFLQYVGVCGLLASAAGCRGGPSARTADALVKFLTALAFDSKAAALWIEEGAQVDLTKFDETHGSVLSTRIAVLVSRVSWSVLSTSQGRSLWKQRLFYITGKEVVRRHKCCADVGQAVPLGALATAAQLICSADLELISGSDLSSLAEILVSGLQQNSLATMKAADLTILELTLAAVIKLLNKSSLMSGFTEELVSGSLRAYAIAGTDSHDKHQLVCKILSLQILAGLSKVDYARHPSMRDAIVTILGSAMNHPSYLLRQAAVDVRNEWYLQ